MPADLTALRKLAKANLGVAGVLRAASRMKVRENHTALITLHRFSKQPDGHQLSHDTLLIALRALDGLGFGQLLHPNRRHRATFHWHVDPRAVSAAAFDASIALAPRDFVNPAARPEPPPQPHSAPAIPAGWRHISFPLRPEGEATLQIPADLTAAEARRLGHLLLAHAQD